MDYLTNSIEDALKSSEKLILVIGRPGSGKSKVVAAYSKKSGIPVIDLSKIITNDSEDLKKTMKSFIENYRFDILLLDNKRALYQTMETAELMDLLKELSEKKIVIATWNGYIVDGQLSHIVNGKEDVYPVDGSYQYIIV